MMYHVYVKYDVDFRMWAAKYTLYDRAFFHCNDFTVAMKEARKEEKYFVAKYGTENIERTREIPASAA